MDIGQLHEYLGELLQAGVDPHTIVCLPEGDDGELFELEDCDLVQGAFREDPSPKLPAPLFRQGQVIRLKSVGFDCSSIDPADEIVIDLPVEAPEKKWPNGWGK